MIYKDNDEVMVENSQGITVKGVVISKSDFPSVDELYWVRYQDNGHEEVSLFTEASLNQWNTRGVCTCGTNKLKISDRHSHWCDSNYFIT